MVTTGTYNFNPSAGDITLNAFALVGVKRSAITTEHLENAYFQANLLGVDITNRTPNRWQMAEVDLTFVPGVPTYNLPNETVAVSAVWVDQVLPNPVASPISRVLGPLSAVEYASLANKLQQGTPTTYFFDLKTPTPTLTFWLVPNGVPEFVGRVQTFRQQQDTNLRNGATVDTPYRFLDAVTFGLASRLAIIYPDPARPNLSKELGADYESKFRLAAALDQEDVSLKLAPNLSGYFPR